MDRNRRLAELLGICWHVPESMDCNRAGYCRNCGQAMYVCADNPDFAADPRLVLKEMRKRGDFPEFLVSLDVQMDPLNFMDRYILDTAGKLRDAAIEFLEKEGKG